jgi:uncharacterized protein (TIGR03435 family)
LIAAALSIPLIIRAQTLSFEVASVKPRPAGDSYAGRTRWNLPDGFTATDSTLQLLVLQTYQLLPYRLSGGPAWSATERFDIVAKAERQLTDDEKRAMVRALLEQRFKLMTHRESRNARTYALVRARNDGRLGTGLKPTVCEQHCGVVGSFAAIIAQGVDMNELARRLEPMMRTTVVDETALSGRFDFRLRFSPESLPGTPAAFAKDDEAPSIFTALEEELGLKLEPRRGQIEMLVIDSAERPIGN